MKIMLKPFAMLRESLPPEAKTQEIEAGSTVADLLAQLQHSHPLLKPILQCTRVACQNAYLTADEVLKEGREYDLIPPVSGG
jgi:molybdopterin converting factor small subunit